MCNIQKHNGRWNAWSGVSSCIYTHKYTHICLCVIYKSITAAGARDLEFLVYIYIYEYTHVLWIYTYIHMYMYILQCVCLYYTYTYMYIYIYILVQSARLWRALVWLWATHGCLVARLGLAELRLAGFSKNEINSKQMASNPHLLHRVKPRRNHRRTSSIPPKWCMPRDSQAPCTLAGG